MTATSLRIAPHLRLTASPCHCDPALPVLSYVEGAGVATCHGEIPPKGMKTDPESANLHLVVPEYQT